jgi:hypothetical protein
MAGKRPGPGVPTATNRAHFACFACRKAFKQAGSSNWDSNVPARPFPCPECKRPMARMGRHFKAPRQRAVRAWRKVGRLYLASERFD